jgi:hypothetical protein
VTYQTVQMPTTRHCQQVPGQAKAAAASPGGCRTFLSATSAGRWTGLQFQAHSLKACTDQTPGPQRPPATQKSARAPGLRAFTAASSASGLSNSGLQRALPPWRHWPRYLLSLRCAVLYTWPPMPVPSAALLSLQVSVASWPLRRRVALLVTQFWAIPPSLPRAHQANK